MTLLQQFATLGQQFGRDLKDIALKEASSLWETIKDKSELTKVKQTFYSAADASYKAKIGEIETEKQRQKEAAKKAAALANDTVAAKVPVEDTKEQRKKRRDGKASSNDRK